MLQNKTKLPLFVRKPFLVVYFAFVLSCLTAVSIFATAHPADASTPTLNFQARLLTSSGAIVADGYYDVEFKIYSGTSCNPSTGSGCTADWTEDYFGGSTDNRLRVADGYLTANLGSITPFNSSIPWGNPLWLSINIGGTSDTSSPTLDGAMFPYLTMTSVPAAMSLSYTDGTHTGTLGFASSLSGNDTITLPDASGTVCLATSGGGNCSGSGTGYILNQSGSSQTGNFNISGIGEANALQATSFDTATSGALNVGGTNAISISVGNTGETGATQLQGGSGGVMITTGTGGTITIGSQAASTTNTIDIGSTATNANADVVNIDTESANTGSINIGGTGNATGTITLGQSTGSNTIGIGNGVTASSSTQTISIGTQGASGSTTTIKLGSIQANDTTELQAGTTSELLSNSGDTIQTATNSSTAFQVQNASGEPIFKINTTTSNLINNPGFEVNYTGWSATGTGANVSRNTNLSYVYSGVGSLGVSLGSGSGTGASTNGFTNSITPGTYEFSFYAMGSAALSGLAVSITGGSAPTCTLNSTTVSTSGFQEYYCSFSSTSTNVTAIAITTTTASQTLYLDSVQLTNTSTLQPYSVGTVQLPSIITNPQTFETTSNSTSALQVDTASGGTVLNVNTSGQQVSVQQSTSSTTTPGLLVQQGGTANATIDLQNNATSSSFFLSDNASSTSANSLVINSYTAATTYGTVTPTAVQDTYTSGTGSASSTNTTFSSNTTAGNLIVVATQWLNSGGITASCSDSQGNTYSSMLAITESTHGESMGICYAVNIKGGADTITVTYSSAATYRVMTIHEFSGIVAVNPVDGTSTNSGTGSSTSNSYTSGSATTTTAGDLIFGYMADDSSSGATATSGTGFAQLVSGSISNSPFMSEDEVQSSAGSTSATFSVPSSDTYAAGMVAFKATPGTTSFTNSDSNSLFTLTQTGQATFRNSANSTTAFLIQNNVGVNLLTGDTSDGEVIIGSGSTGEPNPDLLVLDNASTKPSSVTNGALFYNTTNKTFECGENNVWLDCIGGIMGVNTSAGSAVNNCTSACGAIEQIIIPAAYCQTGRTVRIYLSGVWSTSGTSVNYGLQFYYGSSSSESNDAPIGAATPSISTGSTTLTNVPWSLNYDFICYSSTSWDGQGTWTYANSSTNTTTNTVLLTGNTDTNSVSATAFSIYLFPTWSGTANSSNSTTVDQAIVQGN